MLEVIDLSAFYGAIKALDNISLSVGKGEIIALIGANGAGKTTTLMSISGVVRARNGKILFKGEPVHNLSPDQIVGKGISHVPEGRRIFPRLTVFENIDLGAFLRHDKAGIKKDIAYIYGLFPILYDRRRQSAGTLSGGEQQMLAISRALMARPRLLLFDEPSMGLAPIMVRNIFETIRRINIDQHTTILMAAQNANMALKIAKRGYVMENGRITLVDRAEKLLSNKDVKKAYLGL